MIFRSILEDLSLGDALVVMHRKKKWKKSTRILSTIAGGGGAVDGAAAAAASAVAAASAAAGPGAIATAAKAAGAPTKATSAVTAVVAATVLLTRSGGWGLKHWRGWKHGFDSHAGRALVSTKLHHTGRLVGGGWHTSVRRSLQCLLDVVFSVLGCSVAV